MTTEIPNMALRTSLLLIAGLCLTQVFAQAPALQWQSALGGSDLDRAYAVQQTTDGGYIIAGDTRSNDGDVTGNHGGWDFWVVKLDASGEMEWQKALGGSLEDVANCIQQTTDGGYIVAGKTASNDGDVTGNNGTWDFWVVKLDAVGAIVWQKTLGGSALDSASSTQKTDDCGYIVARWPGSTDGDVTGNHGQNDFWVVKLDAAGSIVWQKALGGSDIDIAYSVHQLASGAYVVAGQTYSSDGDVMGFHGLHDIWIVKLTSSGSLLWQRVYGGTWGELTYSIQETSDGGFIVAGNTNSNDGDIVCSPIVGGFWVLKLDAVGNMVWQKCAGGSNGADARSVQQTIDGGYIVAGKTASNDGDVSGNHGGGDAWVVKLDASGNLAWQKCLGGSSSEVANSIQQTSDGGYIVAGQTSSNDGDVSGHHGNGDFWVVKLDSTNTGVGEIRAPAFTISPNPSDGLVLVNTGRNLSNASITLTDAMGRELLREQMKGHEQVLDLRDRPKGLYLISLRAAEGIASQRLVIE